MENKPENKDLTSNDAKPVLYEGGIFTHYTRLEARKKKKKK